MPIPCRIAEVLQYSNHSELNNLPHAYKTKVGMRIKRVSPSEVRMNPQHQRLLKRIIHYKEDIGLRSLNLNLETVQPARKELKVSQLQLELKEIFNSNLPNKY